MPEEGTPEKEPARRAVVYIRVSSREQVDGYSIPAQRKACRTKVSEEGWMLAGEFTDSGESARTQDRPQFQAMLQALRDDPSIDVLVVHKLDRLARNLEDHVAVKAILKKHGVQLVSVTESLEESASGRLIEGIMASIAEFYSANLAQEVAKGMNEKARRGGWPTTAPIGYTNVRLESPGTRRGEAIIVPDENQAPLVREAFDRYATGDWSVRDLHAEMTRRGLRTRRGNGTPMSRSKFGEMLQNPAYIGKVSWRGEEYDGIHEPLVTEETFNRAQEVFRVHDKAGVRRRRQSHYLRGTLYCGGCGSRMSTMKVKDRYTYAFCLGRQNKRTDCQEPFAQIESLEEQIEDLYRDMRLPESISTRLRTDLRKELKERTSARRRSAKLLDRQRRRLEAERAKAMEAYYSDAINADQLRAEQRRIDTETERINEQLNEAKQTMAADEQLVETSLTLADDLHRAYTEAGPQVRRQYNQALLGRVYVADGSVTSTPERKLLAATTETHNPSSHGSAG